MIIDDVAQQVQAWTVELSGWVDTVAGVFSRPEPRLLLEQMTIGLLSPVRKKNGWSLAEQAGHTHPGRMQTFLCRGAWDAAALEAKVRELVLADLADPEDGVLIVDDTQMIKKGTKSVGVAPQHCGLTNQIENCQIENCQVVVMLAYAGRGGHAFIGHRLYLPERWTKDPARCRAAAVPKDVEFATKPHQAVELFAEADDPSTQPLARVHGIGGQAGVTKAGDLLERATRWERRSCGHGAKGNGSPTRLTGPSSPSPCRMSRPRTGTPTP